MPLDKDRTSANVRERERTKNLNMAYEQLKNLIPSEPSDKMTKKMILKLAQSYIDFLNQLLREGDEQATTTEPKASSLASPVTSPSSSSRSNPYAHLSQSASEEEEEHGHHRSKRLRLNADHFHPQLSPPNTCNAPLPVNSQAAARQDYVACRSHGVYGTGRAQSPPASDTSSSLYPDIDHQHHLIQDQHDNLRLQLRNAFRRYRSGKRKSRS